MDHFVNIYQNRAADYHRMIMPEDAEGNVLKAIERVCPVANKRIVDFGTGTGRLPLLFGTAHATDRPAQIVALDLHWAMLREQQKHTHMAHRVQADMRHVPLGAAQFDLAIAGWSIGHLCGWYAADWQTHVGRAIIEMRRVTAPSGHCIILETLGTGSVQPNPPTEHLARYYAWLEKTWGFMRQAIATDYIFANVTQAIAYTEFFFGTELSDKIRTHNWSRLPEWTGVWHWRKP